MMEMVTIWLRQVVAAAFFSAAVAALIPAGAIKRIALLACSLLLLMALFRPLMGEGGLKEPGKTLDGIEEKIQRAAADFEEENLDAWAALIEEELVSYIEARAEEAGVHCEVSITLAKSAEGIPLPVAAELTAAQRSEEIHRCIREELGIAEENIRWRTG